MHEHYCWKANGLSCSNHQPRGNSRYWQVSNFLCVKLMVHIHTILWSRACNCRNSELSCIRPFSTGARITAIEALETVANVCPSPYQWQLLDCQRMQNSTPPPDRPATSTVNHLNMSTSQYIYWYLLYIIFKFAQVQTTWNVGGFVQWKPAVFRTQAGAREKHWWAANYLQQVLLDLLLRSCETILWSAKLHCQISNSYDGQLQLFCSMS